VINITLIPSSFDPKADAKALREAMEGLGKLLSCFVHGDSHGSEVYLCQPATMLTDYHRYT